MYNSYQIPNNYNSSLNYPYSNNNSDNRLVGGFLGPFLLGGITGGLVSPFFYGNNRPYYNNNYYYPYPPRPYPPYGPYYR